jgi:hypothetical protein
MANVKIPELPGLASPSPSDLVPVADVSTANDDVKKTTVGEIVGIINGDVDVADDGTATISELPVSKLADGTPRQLLQTDAAGTGVEWTSNVDVPGTLGVTGQSTLASAAVSDLTSGRVVLAGASGELEDNAGLTFNGTQLDVDGDVVITGDLTVEGATTTFETQTVTVEDKNIELGVVGTPTDTTADGGGITLKGTTDKTINWVDATEAWTFSEHIDLASAKEFRIAGTKVLDATSLGSAVVSSSLTSVGTLTSGGLGAGFTTVATAQGGTGQTTYADGELLIGNATGNTLSKATLTAGTGISVTNSSGSIAVAIDSSVVTTNDTGTVTSTMISDDTIVNDDINASAAIADTKLDTISTVGKVSNSATTATDANTANAIVARDASGDFSAGTITANLTGNAATATKLNSSRTFEVTGDVTGTVSSDLTSGASIATSIASGAIVDADINASAAIAGTKIDPDFGSQTVKTTGVFSAAGGAESTPSITFTDDIDTGIYRPGADGVAISNGGTERIRIVSTGTLYTFVSGNAGNYFATDQAAGTSATIIRGAHSATANATDGTECFQVLSNGNVVNTNNSYGSLSDIKLKENIVDASSQWDDLKALQVRKYNFKEGRTHPQIGLIAQEVELVSPGLVTKSPDRDIEGNDLGTVTKSVNYSVLYMKAVKALQEAMERIETLEAKVAALEAS